MNLAQRLFALAAGGTLETPNQGESNAPNTRNTNTIVSNPRLVSGEEKLDSNNRVNHRPVLHGNEDRFGDSKLPLNNYSWYDDQQAREIEYNAEIARFNAEERANERTVSEMMAEEDANTDFYRQHGLVNGTPGSISSNEVRQTIQQIRGYGISNADKYDALEALYWGSVNNLEAGAADNVIQEIAEAQMEALYAANEDEGR